MGFVDGGLTRGAGSPDARNMDDSKSGVHFGVCLNRGEGGETGWRVVPMTRLLSFDAGVGFANRRGVQFPFIVEGLLSADADGEARAAGES